MGCSKTDREERRVRQTARSFDGEVEREESLGNKTLHTQMHRITLQNKCAAGCVRPERRGGRGCSVSQCGAAGQQSLPLTRSQPLISFLLRWTPNTVPSGDKYIFPPPLFFFLYTFLHRRPFPLILLFFIMLPCSP